MKPIPLMKRTPLSVFLILALHSTTVEAGGVYTWNGLKSNDASDINNWSYNSNPLLTYDILHINSNSPSPLWTHTDASGTSFPYSYDSQIEIGQKAGANGLLTLRRSDSLYSYIHVRSIEVGTNSGRGVLDIYTPEIAPNQGYATVIKASNGIAIGSGLNSQGTVNIFGSGKTTQSQNMQSATLDIDASNSVIAIGTQGGHGVMNINGGSVSAGTYNSLSTANFVLGQGRGSYGEVNVLAGGKLAQGMNNPYGTTDNQPRIGDSGGTGILNIIGSISKDAVSRAHFGSGLSVGYGSGSVGQINITDGGEMLTGNTFDINSYNPQTGGYTSYPVNIGVSGGIGRVLIDGASGNGKASIWRVIGPFYATGGAPVMDGKLYIGASGQGDVTVSNEGILDVGRGSYGPGYDGNYSSYYHLTDFTSGTGAVYLGVNAGSSGSLNIGARQGLVPQRPGDVRAAEIYFGAGDGSLVFNHTSQNGTYSFKPQLISGTGKSNIIHLAGVTRLEDVGGRDQSTFTGQTKVSGGTLVVDTRLGGSVIVENRAVLTGKGAAGNTIIKSGGILAPERFAKTPEDNNRLYVDSLTFEPGSVYEIGGSDNALSDDVWATTAYGGSGRITINGGSIHVKARAGAWSMIGFPYTVLISDSGDITGKFASTTTDMAFLDVKAEYYPDVVVLRTSRNSTKFEDIPDDDNGKGTGGAVEDLGPGNPIYQEVIGMTPEEANRTFENLNGEIHAGVMSTLLNTSRYSRVAVNHHLLQLPLDAEKGLWVDTWGYNGSLDGNKETARLNYNGTGFLLGLDTYISETGESVLGFAMGYERSKTNIDSTRQSRADLDTIHGMVYGRSKLGTVDLRGGFGLSSTEVDTTRNVNVPGVAGKYTADYSALNLQAFIEASRKFSLGDRMDISPYVNLSHQNLKTRGFKENGGGAALRGNARTSSLTSSIIGFHTKMTADSVVSVYSDLGWKYNFNTDATGADLNFVDGARRFKIHGQKLNDNSLVAGLGVGFKPRKDVNILIGYEGEFGNQEKNNAVKAQFEWRF